MKRRLLTDSCKRAILALAALVLLPNMVSAVMIDAVELITDLKSNNKVNLRRIREIDGAVFEIENNDSVIRSENAVSGAFGKGNKTDVSYTHLLDWVTLPDVSWVAATLEIRAKGVAGGDDHVYVDSLDVGVLKNGGPKWTSFDNEWISFRLNLDQTLDVLIDKSAGDGMNIMSSRLSASGVPDSGTTMALLGIVLAGLGAVRRRFAI